MGPPGERHDPPGDGQITRWIRAQN
jgi:hypothetical protein